MDSHLRASIEATRSQLKSAQRVIRTSLQFLADLEEQLDNAQPQEAERYGSNGHSTARGRVVIKR